MTTPFDYDRDPDRFRLATRVTEQHLTGVPSLYELLAGELAREDPRRILDIGCGEGALRAALPAGLRARTVGLDASATMLSAHPPPVVQADATALPFLAGGFGAAVAVNVLDHLADPAAAIREAHRVLADGGCRSPRPSPSPSAGRCSWPAGRVAGVAGYVPGGSGDGPAATTGVGHDPPADRCRGAGPRAPSSRT